MVYWKPIFTLLCLLPGVACAQPTVSGLTATPQPGNVLRYACSFTTSQAARGFVEYVWWDGQDSIRAKTGFTDSATTHQLTILGLVPQQTVLYRAVAFDATGCYPGAWDTFATAAVPVGVTHARVIHLSGVAGDPPGYVLTHTTLGNPDRYVQVHDRKGRLRWYERMPGIAAATVDGPCQSFTYNPDTRSILFTDCGSVMEMALDGTTLNSLHIASLAPGWMPHHDVFRNAAGNWLMLVARVDTIDKSSVGGDPNALVVGPGILEYTPSGSLVWSWSAFDHRDPLASPAPGGDWVAKLGPQAINWLDANSLMEDADGNPMLSLAGANQVIKIARSGSSIVWACGSDGDIEILPLDSFQVMNGLRPAQPGHYLAVDNRGLDSLSRAIEWWIDFSYIHARMEVSWEHILPAADFTADDGNVHALSNGNYMIASAEGRSVTEITHAGSLLWRAVYDSALTRAFWVEDFYARIHPQYLGDSVVCASDSLVILRATPSGGIWSGPFVSGDTFDAAAAAAGFFPLTYKWGPEELHFELMVDPGANCGVGVAEGTHPRIQFSAFPNPFRGHLGVELDLEQAEELALEVRTMDGRTLIREYLGKWSPGHHQWQVDWEGKLPAPGAYWLRLQAASGKAGTQVVVRQ